MSAADRRRVRTAYLTIGRDTTAEVEARRSRFRCTLRRVETEEQAREVIAAVRSGHADAGHHCSAMVLGPDRSPERSSDDGEPAGTAGAPMLDVLRGAEVSDVVAVVTRWFGGTLLGSGGLIRAYGGAVRAALHDIPRVRRILVEEHWLAVSHAHAGRIENDLRGRGVHVMHTEYAEQARIRLGAPAGERDELAAVTAEATAGAGELTPAGTRWLDRPVTVAPP
ncbi:MAG: IMPACT family protein [Ornithinimicrobium sp.]|uniref:IMPACT family protein n=1 Tax=Ornithinimicrobium sp. TaxID=1977084 RepID=UPI003D9AF61D